MLETQLYLEADKVTAQWDGQDAARAEWVAETAAALMEWYTKVACDSACLSRSLWSARPVVVSVHCAMSPVAECLEHEIRLYAYDK